MNRFKKYCPNVFVAVCEQRHEKGEIIELTSRRGNVSEHQVHNYLGEKDGKHFYSITRADGYNLQERAKNKAEKYSEWADIAESKSEKFYERSNKDADFLSLGEPIKVGHHSERRHRKVIEQAQNNMSRSVEMQRKAESHQEKAEYWESRTEEINLSIPESLEYYREKLEKAKEYHAGLKSGKYPRRHSYSVAYANKDVKKLQKKVLLAEKLWGEAEPQH
jgi:hypothetical protein